VFLCSWKEKEAKPIHQFFEFQLGVQQQLIQYQFELILIFLRQLQLRERTGGQEGKEEEERPEETKGVVVGGDR